MKHKWLHKLVFHDINASDLEENQSFLQAFWITDAQLF